MLATFRSIAKSKLFLIVLGLPLILSLLLFGNVQDAFGTLSMRDAVVSAGDRGVTSAEFKQVFDDNRKTQAQQSGRQMTTEEAAEAGAIEGILAALAQRESLMAILSEAGVTPSDKLLVAEVRKNPAFFDQVTRQFDEKQYQDVLLRNGRTAEGYRRELADSMAQAHFSYAVADGVRAPAVYSALVAALVVQERTAAAFVVDPRSVGMPDKPTDDQLNAFIREHRTEMMLPEMRSLTVVRMSAKALESAVQIDAAEVQKRFDFRRDTLSTPEKRTVVQVPAKDAAAAAAIAARLLKGEDPAAVAKANGVEPIRYADAPRTAISDPAIAAAAFTLPQGQVSRPIQGSLGWAVVKVLTITPGQAVSLDSARPGIEAELRAEAAEERVYALVTAYEKAHTGGSSLKEAARSAGVTALELPPVTAQGTDLRGQPQPMVTQKVLTEAFGLPEGGESDVIDDGKGEYFAVRVDKVVPAQLRTLASDREPITAYYMQTKLAERMKARLDGLAERVRKGENIDAVAASAGAKVQRITLNRQQAEQDQTQRRQVLQAVFAAKPNEVFTAGAAVIKIEQIKSGPIETAARLTRGGEGQMRQSIMQDLMGTEAMAWATRTMKVKTDVNRARAAVGLAPLDKAAEPAAKTKAK